MRWDSVWEMYNALYSLYIKLFIQRGVQQGAYSAGIWTGPEHRARSSAVLLRPREAGRCRRRPRRHRCCLLGTSGGAAPCQHRQASRSSAAGGRRRGPSRTSRCVRGRGHSCRHGQCYACPRVHRRQCAWLRRVDGDVCSGAPAQPCGPPSCSDCKPGRRRSQIIRRKSGPRTKAVPRPQRLLLVAQGTRPTRPTRPTATVPPVSYSQSHTAPRTAK